MLNIYLSRLVAVGSCMCAQWVGTSPGRDAAHFGCFQFPQWLWWPVHPLSREGQGRHSLPCGWDSAVKDLYTHLYTQLYCWSRVKVHSYLYMCRHSMVYGVDTAPHPLLRHTWRPSQCMPRTLLLHSQLLFLSASLSSKSRSGFALLVEVE